MKYQLRPIEAIQWTGDNVDDIREFASDAQVEFCIGSPGYPSYVYIDRCTFTDGEWIIRSPYGYQYMSNDTFQRTYEPVEE